MSDTLNREKRALLIVVFIITGIIFLWRACSLPPDTGIKDIPADERVYREVSDSAYLSDTSTRTVNKRSSRKKKDSQKNRASSKSVQRPTSPLEKPTPTQH